MDIEEVSGYRNYLNTDILQNIFVVLQKKESLAG